MNSDDIITVDLSNIGLGMYSCDTITLDDTNMGAITMGSPTTVNTGSYTINLDGADIDLTSTGVGSWYEERRIIDEHNEEKALRENNEGIQKAWEQYKILVELAKNPPEIV